jgi:hypothetical protein
MKQTLILSLLVSSTVAFVPQLLLTHKSNSPTGLASAVDDKTEVREYFNTEGFSRWNKIYSESDDVNSVQMDIRTGHDQTIQKILNWIRDDGDIKGKTVCDCGCGVGSLAIPLAQMGAFFSFHFIPPEIRLMTLYRNKQVLTGLRIIYFKLVLSFSRCQSFRFRYFRCHG